MHYSFLRRTLVALIILCYFAGRSSAQFDTDYTPLRSEGTLPDEFIRTARAVSEEEIKKIPYGADKSAKDQFAMSNNYFLRDLLLSGDVLVNDPLTIYVNKVVDEILKQQPQLRASLHVYVTKSPDVNAYAFDKGFIFVNAGLLAQLENEAQLAFVLSHEITHVVKKHSVNEYIENIRLEKGTSNYSRGSLEERTLAKFRFSKEQESIADMEGLKLMKQTGYSIKSLDGAFDVMQYSYLPFELIDFKKNFFEDDYLKMPDSLFLKDVADIKTNDSYDDSKSTHPNISKRRVAIYPELVVEDEASRKKYVLPETEFKTAREAARFECCKLYLAQRDYVNAIYASYILQQKHPQNLYLKKVIAKAFYNILVSKAPGKSYGSTSSISIGDGSISSGNSTTDYTNIEGPSQRLYYLLQNLGPKELNTIALSYTFKAHRQFPGDVVLSDLTDSLFSVMINNNEMYLNDFSKKTKEELKVADTVKAAVVPDAEESKYATIKKLQQDADVKSDDSNFMRYAFVGLLKDEEFVARFSKMAKGNTQKPLEEDTHYYYTKTRKKGDVPFLGIEKVVFLDPFYMNVKSVGSKLAVDFYKSEDQQKVLAEIQRKCADKLKLQYTEVSTKDMTPADIQKYNDNTLLNDWLGERFSHGDNNDELVTNTEYIKPLIERLGTRYVAWSGIYNGKSHGSHNVYFFILMDLETGRLMKYETRYTKSKDTKDLLTSYVYNSLMHVKNKPK